MSDNAVHTTKNNWFWRTFPAFDSLRHYSLDVFRRDLIAGLTVAAVAVPQAMAYASIVGLPVEYGLYTAMVMTAVGAIFDSSKQLINGPTNAISIAVLSALGGLEIVDVQDRVTAAILIAFLIGLFQTGIALLRLGDLTRYISHAVIVGFTFGAAILLVFEQIKNLFGLAGQGGAHDHFLVRLWLTLRNGGPIHPATTALGFGTIAFVLGMGWINRRFNIRIPELLLAVVLAATVTWASNVPIEKKGPDGKVATKGVAVVGRIPRTLPSFESPKWDWSRTRALSGSALAIGMLGLLEAIAMAKAIAARTGDKIDLNQQCLSEGLANMTGSFFQCYAGSGSLTRSAINHMAGGVTQWSGVISAIAVGATVLLFAPYAFYIPRSALAGILMVSASRMVDAHKLAFHLRVTKMDAVIVLATAFAAIAVSVEFCILIGTFVSFLIYLPRAARVSMTQLMLSDEGLIREKRESDVECNRLLIFSVEGELFYGSCTEFEAELERIELKASDQVRVVLLRLKYARNLDGVCLDLLERFIERMEKRHVTVILCGVRPEMTKVMANVGLVERLGTQRVFPEGAAVWSSTLQAVKQAYELLDHDRCHTCPLKQQASEAALSWNYSI